MKLISIDLHCKYDLITSNYRFEHMSVCVCVREPLYFRLT